MNFRKTVASRALGDLNSDGKVDFNDFRQWKAAYVGGGGSLAGIDLGLGAVPEPGTLVPLLIAGVSFIGSRGRRQTAR